MAGGGVGLAGHRHRRHPLSAADPGAGVRAPATPLAKGLLASALGLCAFPLIMVFSSSEAEGSAIYGHSRYYFQHRILWLLIGCAGGLRALGFDYHRLGSLAPAAAAIVLALLVLVLVPHLGVMRNGARRWFGFGAFTIQPAEIAKVVMVVYLARWLEKSGDRVRTVREGLVPFLVILGAIVG